MSTTLFFGAPSADSPSVPDIFQVLSGPITGPLAKLANSLEGDENDSHVQLVQEAAVGLDTTFRIVSGSYAGTLLQPVELLGPRTHLDLAEISRSFGGFGVSHLVVQDGRNWGLFVLDGNDGRSKKSNFVLIKAAFANLNISIKIYQHSYFQIFGLSDSEDGGAGALEVAHVIARFVVELLNAARLSANPHAALFTGHSALEPVSLLAANQGLFALGLGFDLDVVEKIWSAAARMCPHQASVSRHPKNKSVIVSLLSPTGKKLGSQIYHSTGTCQVMGVRDLFVSSTRLRALIDNFPTCVMVPLKKRRIRSMPQAARVKRNRLQQQQQHLLTVDNVSPSRSTSTSSSSTSPPNPLDSLVNDDALLLDLCHILGASLTPVAHDSPYFAVDFADLLSDSDLPWL